MDAAKLATKVQRVLQKQIKAKGYEVTVVLLTVVTPNPEGLSIVDVGGGPDPHSETIKIVVTAHDLKENATDIGDNPDEVLEFIVIEDGTEPDALQVKEGRILLYDNKRFNIELASPSTLAGQLIIKEVIAKAVK
jgi:hypothetical protein